ncbi:hypothetical protein MIND_00788800 [Mycena indigotica]|uniref:Uncharacterized protein n=1 Tax=Mycena indigotica TaxID=2126181 RepID=A0A8H6SM89_9AGAR|nr:uncharacterized protein MIND_00788800 [Mycena indigotica]KAF7302218.1 hypothetical protein MIND_00788800 [Mycena indigotica]
MASTQSVVKTRAGHRQGEQQALVPAVYMPSTPDSTAPTVHITNIYVELAADDYSVARVRGATSGLPRHSRHRAETREIVELREPTTAERLCLVLQASAIATVLTLLLLTGAVYWFTG